MAGLLGHAAQPRLPLLTLVLSVGCGEPIANAPFLEEPSFVDALITEAAVAPPEALAALAPDDGFAPLLASAVSAVRTYADFVALPVVISEKLREVGPQERTSQRRSWSPVSVTLPLTEGTDGGERLLTAWVQADVLRIDEERFEVLVEMASTEAGPYQTVATATVDGGVASWRWDLGVVVDALALVFETDLETLTIALDPEGGEFGRRVEVGYGTPPAFSGFWVLDGDALFASSGIYQVTDDDLGWPGQITVVHTEDGGGASGEVFVDEEPVAFTACWDGNGTAIWQGGADPRLRLVGTPDDCPVL